MENRIVYDLVDGKAVIDKSYRILSANEDFYRFIGLAHHLTFLDDIHFVDQDDFIDVFTSLKVEESENIVLRMRRSDNSYHWITVDITRKRHLINGVAFDYYELDMADVVSMKNKLQEMNIYNSQLRSMLKLENEIMIVYFYKTNQIRIYDFEREDNKERTSADLDLFFKNCIDNKLIREDTIGEFKALFEDIKNAKLSFSHDFATSLYTYCCEYEDVYVKMNTIYDGNEPDRCVGSVKFIPQSAETSTRNQVIKESADSEIKRYCANSIMYNPDEEFSLLKISFDDMELIEAQLREKVYSMSFNMVKEAVRHRGFVVIAENKDIYIAIMGVNYESYLRSFIQSLRNHIVWSLLLNYGIHDLTFSISVVRYPENGNNIDMLFAKLDRGLDIALNRGKNRYIIYREHLHGEISMQDIEKDKKEKEES